jgi:hypothetical protein
MNPVTASIQPYLIWIKIGVVLIIVGSIFWAGWSVNEWRWESKENTERKALIDKIEKERAEWERERERVELQSQITAGQLSNLEMEKDTLLATLSGLKMTRTITVKPNAQGECDTAVLDDSFRLRWNAVVQQTVANAASDSRN